MENLSVKALVKMLGVNEHTVRAWERRYGAIAPQRDSNGRRLYSSEDIDRIRLLTALVERGHSIGHIARLPTTQLRDMTASDKKDLPPGAKVAPLPVHRLQEPLLNALRDFDLQRLSWTLQKARFHLSPRELITELMAPAMTEVGKMVDKSEISVAQEHALSCLLRDILGEIYQSLSPYDFSSRMSAPAVGLTTREGDLHEFGIMMAAILCALNGYRVHYFGPNLPADDLCSAAHRLSLDLVIVGLSPIPSVKEVVKAPTYIRKLDQLLPKRTALWLGGRALIDMQDLKSDRKMVLLTDLDDLDMNLKKI